MSGMSVRSTSPGERAGARAGDRRRGGGPLDAGAHAPPARRRRRASPWRLPAPRPVTVTRPPTRAAAARKYEAVEASGSTRRRWPGSARAARRARRRPPRPPRRRRPSPPPSARRRAGTRGRSSAAAAAPRVGGGQQQAGQELARRVPGHRHLAAGQAAGRHARSPAGGRLALVADLGAQRPDAVEHRPHGPGPQRRRAVDAGSRPAPSATTGSRKRLVVPDSRMSRASGPGAAGRRCPDTVSRPAARPRPSPCPSATRAVRMASVSSATRAPSTVDVPSASAAHTSARLVRLFDPGTATVASSGPGQGRRPGLRAGVTTSRPGSTAGR